MKTIPDPNNNSHSYILHKHLFEFIKAVETNSKTPPNVARAYFLFGSIVWNSYAIVDSRFPLLDGFSCPRMNIPTSTNPKTMWKFFYILFCISWNEIRTILYPSLPILPNPSPRIRLNITARFTAQIRLYLQQRQSDGYNTTESFTYPNQGKYIQANSGVKQNLVALLTPHEKEWAPLQTILSPTSTVSQSPLQPYFGEVRNWFSSTNWNTIDGIATDFYPSTSLFEDQIENLKEINSSLSPEEKMKAEVWAGFEPTRATPPGKSMILLALLLASKEIELKESVALICGAGSCLFHAAVAAWKIKYQYMQARPIQIMRINYDGQNIVSPDDGVVKDGGLWIPYQPISLYTPPFPDYISGHSTFTMVFASFMNLALGSDTIPLQGCTIDPSYFKLFSQVFDPLVEPVIFSNLSIKPDSSLIVDNTPSTPIELKWENWSDIAREAGMSRIYGGIHWENSNAGGLAVGQAIAPIIMEKLSWGSLPLKF